jgi:hypothetical protein
LDLITDRAYAVTHLDAFCLPPSTLRQAQGWQAQDVRRQGTCHFLYFVFALYERKNEVQKEEKVLPLIAIAASAGTCVRFSEGRDCVVILVVCAFYLPL